MEDERGTDDEPDAGPAAPGRGILRRAAPVLWGYVRAQPGTYTVSMVGATLYAAAAVGTAVALRKVTDEVIVPSFSTGRVGAAEVRAAGLMLFLVGVTKGLSILLRRYFAALTTFRTQARLRRSVSDHYLDVSMSYVRRKPAGELLAHADADVIGATEVLNPLPFSVGVIALIVFAVVSLLIVDPVLTLIAVLLFPSLALLNRVYTRAVEVPVEAVQARVGDVSSLAHESFDGALAVKTLGLADHETARMDAAAGRLRDARLDVGRVRAMFEPAIDALPNLGQVALLLVGAWRVSSGALTTGDLVQGIALFGLLAFPMRVVGFFLQEMPRAVVSAARLDGVLAEPVEPLTSGARSTLPAGALEVAFDDVGFAYEPDVPVLDGVSFTVGAGEVVAIVGSTGSGKTTLCELLVRLAEPTSGRVLVGGVDVRELDRDDLRAAVALVFQETFLFADSLTENVDVRASDDGPSTGSTAGGVRGVAGAIEPSPEVRAAAEVARAHEFVAELPGGWGTVVGERGVTLSGGQRQRIALARALSRRPRVLVLDDATSAVDPMVERDILDGLRSTLDTTTLVVAHRVSTILMADRIVFLQHGRVRGEGTHAALLADPAYERIVRAYEDVSAA